MIQIFQPGGDAVAAAEVCRGEDCGCHHLLHLTGQHSAPHVHMCACGFHQGRGALPASLTALLQRGSLLLGHQQLRQLLVRRLAECLLLSEGP